MSTQLYAGSAKLPELPFTDIDGIYVYGANNTLFLDVVRGEDIISINLGETFVNDVYWEVLGNDPQIFGSIISDAFKEGTHLQITETQFIIKHMNGRQTIFPMERTDNYIAFNPEEFSEVLVSTVKEYETYLFTLLNFNDIMSVHKEVDIQGWILQFGEETKNIITNSLGALMSDNTEHNYFNEITQNTPLYLNNYTAKFILDNAFDGTEYIGHVRCFYSPEYTQWRILKNFVYYTKNESPEKINILFDQPTSAANITYGTFSHGILSLNTLRKLHQLDTFGNIIIGCSPQKDVGVYVADATNPMIGLSCGPSQRMCTSFEVIVQDKFLSALSYWIENELDFLGIYYFAQKNFVGFKLPNNSFLFVVTESSA